MKAAAQKADLQRRQAAAFKALNERMEHSRHRPGNSSSPSEKFESILEEEEEE